MKKCIVLYKYVIRVHQIANSRTLLLYVEPLKKSAHTLFGNVNSGHGLIAFTTEPFDLKCVQLPPHKYVWPQWLLPSTACCSSSTIFTFKCPQVLADWGASIKLNITVKHSKFVQIACAHYVLHVVQHMPSVWRPAYEFSVHDIHSVAFQRWRRFAVTRNHLPNAFPFQLIKCTRPVKLYPCVLCCFPFDIFIFMCANNAWPNRIQRNN